MKKMSPFLNSSKNFANEEEDSLVSLMENHPEKIFCLFFSIVTIIVAPPLLYSIIWFERFGSDAKRTLLDMLLARNCWILIVALYFSHTLDIIRFSYGPLYNTLCGFQNIFKSSIFCMTILNADAIQIARYIYIFKLKNPTAFHDDFWCCFVNQWIITFCLLLVVSLNFITNFQTTIYYICVGKISNSLQQNVLSRGNVCLVILSIIIHSVTHIKIWIHKRQQGGQVFPQTNNAMSSISILKEMEKHTLSRFVIWFLYWCVFGTSIACAVKLGNLKMEKINIYPNYILIYFTNLFAPCFYVFLLIASFYLNKTLRRAIYEEIQNFVPNLTIHNIF